MRRSTEEDTAPDAGSLAEFMGFTEPGPIPDDFGPIDASVGMACADYATSWRSATGGTPEDRAADDEETARRATALWATVTLEVE